MNEVVRSKSLVHVYIKLSDTSKFTSSFYQLLLLQHNVCLLSITIITNSEEQYQVINIEKDDC